MRFFKKFMKHILIYIMCFISISYKILASFKIHPATPLSPGFPQSARYLTGLDGTSGPCLSPELFRASPRVSLPPGLSLPKPYPH